MASLVKARVLPLQVLKTIIRRRQMTLSRGITTESTQQKLSSYSNMQRPQGLTSKTLEHHYALKPLFFIMACGCVWVVFFSFRTLFKNPDVDIVKTGNPNEKYRDKQAKFVNIAGRKYEEACKAPKYDDKE